MIELAASAGNVVLAFALGAFVTVTIPIALFLLYFLLAVFTGTNIDSELLKGRAPLYFAFVLGPAVASFGALAGLTQLNDPDPYQDTLRMTPLAALAMFAGSVAPALIYLWWKRQDIIDRANRITAQQEAVRHNARSGLRRHPRAGWRPNPDGTPRWRWFDGTNWTDHTSE